MLTLSLPRHLFCLRRSHLIPLIVLTAISLAIYLSVTHYRQLSRRALLSDTWQKMDLIKSSVHSMEAANREVKMGIDLLRERVNLLKERFKRANISANESQGLSPW